MVARQYCIRCGTEMELNFEAKKKRGLCPGCKLKFKYFAGKNGAMSYIFNRKDVDNLYVAGKTEEQSEKLIDIATRNTEALKNGTV